LQRINDKEKSDDEVIWDDDDDDDDSSSAAPESSGASLGGSGTIHDDDESEELEGEVETLGHSSKFFRPSSLRDWSEDNDDEQEPPAALGATSLHVATTAAVGGRIPPVIVFRDSPVWQLAVTEPATSKKPGVGLLS
jgi:hypothetical protein